MDNTVRPVWSVKYFLFAYGALVVFGWSVPNDLLPNSPNLQNVCDLLARWIPQIDRVTTIGGEHYGQICRLVYAVNWIAVVVTAPVFFVCAIRRLLGENIRNVPPRRVSLGYAILIPVVLLGAAFELIFLFFIDGTSSRFFAFAFTTRIGIGVGAPILAYSNVIYVGLPILLVWGLVTRRIHIGD